MWDFLIRTFFCCGKAKLNTAVTDMTVGVMYKKKIHHGLPYQDIVRPKIKIVKKVKI